MSRNAPGQTPLLEQVDSGIWICAGETVDFHGFPFPTRMTLIQSGEGNLWIHSPGKLGDALKMELKTLGTVQYLISPNKLHHLFLREWIDYYPAALVYSSPGVETKRPDICFHHALSDKPDDVWKNEIDQMIFRGSPAMEEVVFYHMASRTLLLTDLIENFNPDSLNWWQRGIARFAGILYPSGRTPLDWRLSFYLGSRQQAKESLARIMQWDFDNVILSHGECVFGGGKDFIHESFSWLRK